MSNYGRQNFTDSNIYQGVTNFTLVTHWIRLNLHKNRLTQRLKNSWGNSNLDGAELWWPSLITNKFNRVPPPKELLNC